VRNLLLFIRVVSGKWLWHYLDEKEALWRVVVEFKYESSWGGWCSNEVHGTYRVGIMKKY